MRVWRRQLQLLARAGSTASHGGLHQIRRRKHVFRSWPYTPVLAIQA
jgi:hypothetical protein